MMRYYSWVDVCRLLAKRYDTKFDINMGGFQSQLKAFCVSSHTDELWYNETVHLWMIIGLVGRVFANGPGDLGSIPDRVIPKTLKNGTWYLLA